MTEQKLPAGLWVYKKRSRGYGQEFDPDYCAASVAFGGRRVDFHQCTRKWKVEKRGHRWCTQHDPDKIEEKQRKRMARYEAESKARMRPYRRIKDLETINKDLLEALEAAIQCIESEKHPHRGWHYQAREAIRKAEEQMR